MQENCNGEHCCCHQEPKKSGSKGLLVVFVIVLAAAVGVGGYLLGTKMNSEGTNKTSKKDVKLSQEKLDELLDNSYYTDMKGNDIVDAGVNKSTKLALAFNYIKEANYAAAEEDKEDVYPSKSISGKKLAANGSYVKSDEGYYFSDENGFDFTDDTELLYYPYETVNKIYKKLFNTDAPKMDIEEGIEFTYYYNEKLNIYVEPIYGIGALFEPIPIHRVKDYEVKDGKLILNVYYATYSWDNDDNMDETNIIITMDNDKTIKYTYLLQNDESIYDDMTNDMIKNHSDKLDIVKFIYTIDGDNYYLEEIKK